MALNGLVVVVLVWGALWAPVAALWVTLAYARAAGVRLAACSQWNGVWGDLCRRQVYNALPDREEMDAATHQRDAERDYTWAPFPSQQ